MKITKILAVLLSICMIAAMFTACGKKDEGSESNDKYLYTYTGKEIMDEGLEGFFVQMGKDEYAAIPSEIPGYQGGDIGETDPSRYLWNLDYGDFDKAIPVVSDKHPLVAVFDADKNMPSSLSFEKYEDCGYTLGTQFFVSEDDNIYISLKDLLAGSSAEAAIAPYKFSDDYALVKEIRGEGEKKGSLPYENIEPYMSMLLGPNQGGGFYVSAYTGTKLRVFHMYADTRLFQSAKVTNVVSPYTKTDNNYFIVKMPADAEEGYYYLGDQGFFKYKK